MCKHACLAQVLEHPGGFSPQEWEEPSTKQLSAPISTPLQHQKQKGVPTLAVRTYRKLYAPTGSCAATRGRHNTARAFWMVPSKTCCLLSAAVHTAACMGVRVRVCA